MNTELPKQEFFCRLISETAQDQLNNDSLQLPKDITIEELKETLVSLLEQEEISPKSNYKFFMDGKLIQSTLENHVSKYRINTENVLEIKYCQSFGKPQISSRIEFKDWVKNVFVVDDQDENLFLTCLFSGRMPVLQRDNKGEYERSNYLSY